MSLGDGEESVPALVDVLVGSMPSRICLGGRVHMTWLLVLAGSTSVVGADAVAVGGAESARGPLALDGCLQLGDKLCVIRGAGGESGGGGVLGEERLEVCKLFGDGVRERLVGCDEVVEDGLVIGGGDDRFSWRNRRILIILFLIMFILSYFRGDDVAELDKSRR